MAFAYLLVLQGFARIFRQLEQSYYVSHRGKGFTQSAGYILIFHIELLMKS